ncbi:MAG: hypothetical protein HY536_01030 [Candidatus Colwellbacteria bacterium]|nr:hypothetical protein [Candidatus Colwellbacteria bacterium]
MDTVSSWLYFFRLPLQDLLRKIGMFLPTLFGSLLMFVLGLIAASVVAYAVEKFFTLIRLDALLKRAGFDEYLERAGLRLHSGRFFGKLAYWFIFLVTILAVAGLLGLDSLVAFLDQMIAYIPSFIGALLIVIATVLIADFLKHLVSASAMGARAHSAKFFGVLTWWVVIIFGLVTALGQLGVDMTLFQGTALAFVFGAALAAGLAFGLGGKEYAAHLIERFRKHVEHKE